MFHRNAPSPHLARALGLALARPTAFVVACALVIAVGGLPIKGHLEVDQLPPARTSPAPPDPVSALIARHGCWKHEAPSNMTGKMAGHVVVTRPGAGEPEYAGPPMVDRALNHVFKGMHPRLTVHAFCR